MRPCEIYPRWSSQITLGAADTTKTVQAAPGAGKRLVVTAYMMTVVISAAQSVDLEDTSGTVEVAKMAASLAAGTQFRSPTLDEGLKLTVNEALLIKPAAAGPSVHVWAEGYILPGQ